MAQPVYNVSPITEKDVVTCLFYGPFGVGLLWLAALAANVWTFHPVFRILIWMGAAATISLSGLRSIRILYALAVAGIGTAVILMDAPDLLWKAFLEGALLLIWGPISIGVERFADE